MSRIEIDLKNVDVPAIKKMQHDFIMASNTSPDEKIVTLANAAVVANLKRNGILSRSFTWHATAMSGTPFRDFTVPATRNIDVDIATLAFEMALQKVSPEDMVEALRGVERADQIENFTVHADQADTPPTAKDGQPVAHSRVDTGSAPDAHV